ncbi:uncharacterized protein LAESUDRAFT_682471 [Laetiporus sulphureus 93-53]|uniref:Fungal-type protein kinase domain-containing protein n=1 Tax=Laetiporus sulphureus 93-53 TaxID=1314785 RepID=A0A165DDJ6_9APHY|nr:uncharacterized protein LAESUDRAFT_682471 [Laetiporus sulphureus 93-53]KZT04636.1 hypothetical protein LAESUDRAFT_682471 [Laetiporus sulphureus 93-53]
MDSEGKLCFKDGKEFREIFDITSSSKKPPNGSGRKPVRRDMFKKVYPPRQAGDATVEQSWRERQMYQAFIDVVADNKLCPGYKFTSPADKGDKDDDTKQRVDVAMFKEVAPTDGAPHWGDQALWVEFKRDGAADPFKDNELAANKLKRSDTWAQLITYAARVFETQHRTHLYSILICGRTAYIMRWDRSGVIVTKGFNYITKAELLADFLISFAGMSPAQQGYDTTAELVEPGSADYELMDNAVTDCQLTAQYVKDYFIESLADDAPRWRLKVEGYIRPFLVGKPHFRSWGVFGRGTKGFVAYEAVERKFCWLKDTWRIDLLGMEKEGTIIIELEKEGVVNIPSVLCHGDVLHEVGDELVAQSTLAQKYLEDMREDALNVDNTKKAETKGRPGRPASRKAQRNSKISQRGAKQNQAYNQVAEASSSRQVTSIDNEFPQSDEQQEVAGKSSSSEQGEENGGSTSVAVQTSMGEQQARPGSSLHAHDAAHVGNSIAEENVNSSATTEQEAAQPSTSGQQHVTEEQDDSANHAGPQIPIRKYTHYRLVENEVGMRLEHFRSGVELVSATCDALIAHSQAFEKASRIHRDVSSNNIVIVLDPGNEDETQGLLCDWEFSKLVATDPAVERQRQINRTGTWQFQSAMVLLQPAKAVEVADELEAFYYVLLYNALRYLHNTCSDLPELMSGLFDLAVFSNNDYWCPTHKYLTVTSGQLKWLAQKIYFLPAKLPTGTQVDVDALSNEHPLNGILSTLLDWFKARYVVADADGKLNPPNYLRRAAAKASHPAPSLAPENDGDQAQKVQVAANLQAKWRRVATQSDLIAQNEAAQKRIKANTIVEQRDLARNLETHEAMISLLINTMAHKDWPTKDRAGDQLPGHSHGKVILHEETSHEPAPDPDAIATRTRQRKRSAHASVDDNSFDETDERPAKRRTKIPAPQFTRASSSRGTKRGASDDDGSDGPLEPPAKRARTSRTTAPASQLRNAPAASGSRTNRPRPASKPSSRTRKADISMPPPPVPADSRGSANAPAASRSRSSRSQAVQGHSPTNEAADVAITGARRSGRLSAKDKGKARAY